MTTLLVVEDNALLATTLARFLREQGQFTVAAVVPSAEAALDLLPTVAIDLLLVDVALPGMNGIDLVGVVHKKYPQLPCLMLSAHNEIDYVGRALAAGARGYVLKSDPQTILDAVQRVLAGETYLSVELRKKIYH
jgi:DNA-binding NarL/FixJ family response regulator